MAALVLLLQIDLILSQTGVSVIIGRSYLDPPYPLGLVKLNQHIRPLVKLRLDHAHAHTNGRLEPPQTQSAL